ncbi:hypothetical protein MBAV_002613 [Candidatus Magnetobacterium bavaricum]|uniref:Uncharacterized protein n=1 Tax=Candidatus Magnetobacterium bavaricum TaxID=29290 RepID=A0A0F3GTC7_9BACT|nr:hypothetical protein MBAV_002613 [Candidatus Magnetobacterium bavaricum]
MPPTEQKNRPFSPSPIDLSSPLNIVNRATIPSTNMSIVLTSLVSHLFTYVSMSNSFFKTFSIDKNNISSLISCHILHPLGCPKSYERMPQTISDNP